MTRTICVVTGTRAEYDLLYPLLVEIQADADLRLQIVATGMHLSPEFGLTYRSIEEDGFGIDEKVEMLSSSDSAIGIAESIGRGVSGMAGCLEHLKPDLLVGLGDRFEWLATVVAAAVSRIPVAHIQGGESTEGAYDELFRHAITKMSHLHFAATEKYRRRIVQMGEMPERVFMVGALGIDNITRTPLLERTDLARQIGFVFGPKTFLLTFHPETLAEQDSGDALREILAALDAVPDARIIITKPNADRGGRILSRIIDEYVASRKGKAAAYTCLGRQKYLSALKWVDAVIGNSSSGLIEAPSLQTPTINIGLRQQGRERAASVIDCPARKDDILQAIARLNDSEFRRRVAETKNPYGEGAAAKKIKNIIKDVDLGRLLMKKFQDLGTEGP